MWGDSRIQQSGASYIYNKWKAEVTKAKYLNESSMLYNEIAFSPNDPLEPKVVRPVCSLPRKIEAENWEDAFVVSQAPNNDTASTDPGDRVMCWLTNESWTKYNVNATSTKTYTVSLRISNGSGAATSATIKIDDNTVTTVNIPATADWNTFVTVNNDSFNITAGQHTATVQCNGGFNFNWLQFN